jgi:D-beta-D-heptose 7-phosphate kinase/D-beta-D-heptose 1-phosphate adenosyltransferase
MGELVSLKKAALIRQSLKRQRKIVVFTNGVFDILHAGHVQVLERAKKMGDVLVLGLNRDESVRLLGKGPGRPLNRFKDRARVLAALSVVDYVVGFKEKTPEKTIRVLRPDVLVKGADYSKDKIVGAPFAGKVARIALKKGYSTTALVKKIQGLSAA